MDLMFSLLLGIGLSAASGLRVFVPLLGMSLAALTGHLSLTPGFEWLASEAAVITLIIATVLEIGTYYVPWLDNLMDVIATPAAVAAGTVMTASITGEMSPLLNWSLALIAGGGTAGVVQTGTVALRAASTGTTCGAGNPVVSTGELAGSVAVTAATIFLPILAAIVVLTLLIWAINLIFRRRRASGQCAASPRVESNGGDGAGSESPRDQE